MVRVEGPRLRPEGLARALWAVADPDRRLALERSWDPGRWVGEGRGTGPGPHGARWKIYVLVILLSHIDQPRCRESNPPTVGAGPHQPR